MTRPVRTPLLRDDLRSACAGTRSGKGGMP